MPRPALLVAIPWGLLACAAPPGADASSDASTTAAQGSTTTAAPHDASSGRDGSSSSDAGSTTTQGADESSSSGDAGGTVVVRFAFVHGVLGEPDSQLDAQDQARDMESYLLDHADAHVATYEAAHPGTTIEVVSTRLNLYTDVQGALLVPGLDEVSDDSGIATANRWREQLALQLELAYPGQPNIVVVGHSTGARAAMEVTAGVVDATAPGAHDWGFDTRIAGVVALHGMIDRLGNPEYDFLGPISFLTGCKLAQATGWCEYASEISGVAASDWVATHRHALALIGWGDCSPSLWTGQNDKSLPLRAQGSSALAGMSTTPIQGGAWQPAHGVLYGNFCHSDVTSGSSRDHGDAVAAAMDRVLEWVFVAAPRVGNPEPEAQRIDIAPLPAGEWSPWIERGVDCPDGENGFGMPEVAGSCIHGDGDEHALDEHTAVELEPGEHCTARVRWQHLHAGEQRGARLWVKRYAAPDSAALLDALVRE